MQGNTVGGYPRFHATPIGLAPGDLKMLHPEDLEALCEAFRMLTGKNPYGKHRIVDQWIEYLETRGG